MNKINLLLLYLALCSSASAVYVDHTKQSPPGTIANLDSIRTVAFDKLYSEADIVAFIKISSGDAESYEETIYKATVTQAFKGTSDKETIYFGPYIGYAVGNEYLMFLKNSGRNVTELIPQDRDENSVPYKVIQKSYRVMYAGYSAMPVSYECFLGGKELSDKCDYSVKFNTYQIKLPDTMKTFPKDVGEFSSDKKWVRKKVVEAALAALKINQK